MHKPSAYARVLIRISDLHAWINAKTPPGAKIIRPRKAPPYTLTGCGKTPCKFGHRFGFCHQSRHRERLAYARAGSSERSPGRLREPGGDGAAGSSVATDPPASERRAGASVA